MRFSCAYELWPDPLVLGCQGTRELEAVFALRQPASVLFWPSNLWTMRNIPSLTLYRWKALRSRKQLHFMRNSLSEDRLLRALMIPGALASLNCYINERLFQITNDPKLYDAVYTAQMQPFKRLHLAAKVSSLYVVTYGTHRGPDGAYDLHGFEPSVSHADFNRGWSTFEEIVLKLNQSRVGLALSQVEGAMLGSVEYMLCGLPQVSTPCLGGRELFFDHRFVSVVPPSAQAVAHAVAELIDRGIDPELIRRATLERVNRHRRALSTYVRSVVQEIGGRVPSEDEFLEWLFGAESGTWARMVPLKDFASHGWT